ncbi:MAG: MBL fold metallo-hydrolase [Oleispira sp.]|nr:MBL fold metallo-hydrolase [Oleispira sp.]
MISRHYLLLLPLLASLSACDKPLEFEQGADAQGHTAPTAVTIKANQAFIDQRPFDNTADFKDAMRGLIAQDESLIIKNADGSTIWDMPAYDFIDYQGPNGNAPASVNPSLWRQAALNNIHGLFKVSEGIYQLRGYDLANMTIIEGDSGWILVDPLTIAETADKALKFAQQHLGKKPIRAILYTHSHLDHFGGINGILQNLSAEEKQQLRIIAPAGFMEEATSENIIAGIAMSRRVMYMFGKPLARSERGHVDTGLGKAPAFGSNGLLEPTELIHKTGQTLNIDGVPFEFQSVSGSEAPAEFTFYLPKHKAYCGAEMLSRNMHNLYTLRGAKVRDAKLWSAYIEQARELYADSDVYFASHHWPLWGQEKIQNFMRQQSDTYQYIHDQSVRLFNSGLSPNEIAEQVKMPASLNTSFHNQGYYGTVKHNAKAVYQAYLGWFTGNPAKLDPLPESQVATRYIEMMGGVDAVINKAKTTFDEASNASVEEGIKTYRWLAELLNHAVFAEPDNTAAKQMLAKVYDQLGYQAESGPWRNFYLTGAFELRHGTPKKGINLANMKDVLAQTPVHNFFDSMAVRLNGPDAEGKKLDIKITFTDLNESYLLSLNNSVLRYKKVDKETPADATLNLTQSLFVDMAIGEAGLKDTLFGDELSIEGSKLDLINFFSLLDKPTGTFGIATP